jgi:hypothetical protein
MIDVFTSDWQDRTTLKCNLANTASVGVDCFPVSSSKVVFQFRRKYHLPRQTHQGPSLASKFSVNPLDSLIPESGNDEVQSLFNEQTQV